MTYKSIPRIAALMALSGAASLASCSSHPSNANSGGTGASSTSAAGTASTGSVGAGGGPSTFQQDAPAVYVAKVKNILIGKAPTDAEVQAVVNDTAPPAALKKLIGTWMQDAAYDEKMRVFFSLAFQQTQLTTASFVDMMLPNGLGDGEGIPLLIQNISESFARTVIALNKQGKPLNAAMTTNQFMMTAPLMELYAYLDEVAFADSTLARDPYSTDYLLTDYPKLTGIYQGTAGYENITLAESVDPTSPNFMHFYNSQIAGLMYGGTNPNPPCDGNDPIVYPITDPTSYKQNANTPASYILHWIMYGAVGNHQAKGATAQMPNNCGQRAIPGTMWFSDSDFAEGGWRMVTISQPTGSQKTTRFFDVPSLQPTTANTLTLRTPRIGYFSTPAFMANWSTNSSNQMRVTVNQSLIVATGAFIDGQDATQVPQAPGVLPPGLDSVHAPAGSPCANCHYLLDPLRVVLQSTWSYPYYQQLDPTMTAARGQFVFQGVVNQNINTIQDFAKQLADHPLMPQAWVQKLCYYANSSPATKQNPNGGCDPNDPEFKRIVAAFTADGLKWDDMVTDLLSSPITTNAAPTLTTDEVQVVAVARRDHLCAALNNRLLGGPATAADICGLQVTSPGSTIQTIVGGFPSDGYGRGSPIPVLPTQPNLFYRGGIESVCESVATMLIDSKTPPTGALTWASSTTPIAAIQDFVSILMSIEASDPRYDAAQTALMDHFNAAVSAGASKTTALQSAFTVACMSPSFIGVGM
jgi:hypothetical protein